MDKKIASLLGAVSAFVTVNGAPVAMAATPPTALDAQSYADLLQPIPNAAALLAVSETETKAASANVAGLQVAEHHHHHHHHHYRRHHHHHHHHHHHFHG